MAGDRSAGMAGDRSAGMARGQSAVVVMGEILGSYGVRGSLKVRPFTESPEALLAYPAWWVKPARGEKWTEYARTAGRLHSGMLVVELAGVVTREAALGMKGFEVGVARAALPAAAEGEIYWDDLVGLAVMNRSGILLGEVQGVVRHGGHPLLRVAPAEDAPRPERLIPYVPAIVLRVDVPGGRIDVDWEADY
jgi:16S rRNA processing protein RimM